MDEDLLFIPLTSTQWKKCSASGSIEPIQQEESKLIQIIEAYTPSDIEEILNFKYVDQSDLLLIIVDPLRVQVPIKNELSDISPNDAGHSFGNSKSYSVIHLHGKVSIDAVIDRIPIQRDKDGLFHIHIETID
tara:strand:- start:27 stop:425 length:399 start_codon:yes stop_codon:yes gene_type:complete